MINLIEQIISDFLAPIIENPIKNWKKLLIFIASFFIFLLVLSLLGKLYLRFTAY